MLLLSKNNTQKTKIITMYFKYAHLHKTKELKDKILAGLKGA